MIKNVIFDIGDVLINYKPGLYLKSKLGDEGKAQFVYKTVFLSKEWVLLDEGAISMEDAIVAFCTRNPRYESEIRRAMDGWHEMLTPIESSVKLLFKLKEKGYRLYYLSNYHAESSRYVLSMYDFWALFDGGVFSFAEKVTKPDERIYKIILERYALNPAESVFIDDTEKNVRAAEKVGIKGVVCRDAERLEAELGELLSQ